MRRKPKLPDPPAEAMRKAEQVAVGGDEAFNAAADALQKAVDDKDADAEKFWRQVFDGYTIIVQRHRMDLDEWNRVHTAGSYALGDNPRYDPTLAEEFEKYMAEHPEERHKEWPRTSEDDPPF
jgi:hypothetical protein